MSDGVSGKAGVAHKPAPAEQPPQSPATPATAAGAAANGQPTVVRPAVGNGATAPANAPTQPNQPRTTANGQPAGKVPVGPQFTTPAAPTVPTDPADGRVLAWPTAKAAAGVPVWDPPQPAQPRQSIRQKLGIGRKAEPSTPAAAAAVTASPTAPAQSPVADAPTAKSGPSDVVSPPSSASPAVPVTAQARPVTAPVVAPPAKTAPSTAPVLQSPAAPAATLALAPLPGPATTSLPPAPTTPGQAAASTDPHKQPRVGAARRTRKARLRLSRLDPWSVMKTSFLFSIAAGIMLVVAVYAVWTVLSTSQLFSSINDIVQSVVSTPGDTTPFRVQDYVNTQKVMGVSALLACVDVVIFTALATLGSFLYNLAATMLGGLEITLAED